MTVSETGADAVAPQNDPIAEVRDVSVGFEMQRGQARVVDDVSIDVQRNEILGVVGESGSGKSMFASALLDAVVDPGVTRGDITYYPPDDPPVDVLELSKKELKQYRWEEVAMVFQGAMSSFNPVQSIREHMVETLSSHDYNVERGLDRARGILSDLHLNPERVLQSYPHELSGGMQQRALIALSLVLNPEMLVMDEPTAALDLLMQRSIISLIQDIQAERDLTIIFITHDLPLVAGLADRLAVMYSFKFVELGPADEVLTNAGHPYTRALLSSTPNLTAPIDEMRPISGESPDPVNIPQGCSYHPRCPLATELCEEEDPAPYRVGDDHVANCHYWEEAQDSIVSLAEEAPERPGADTTGDGDDVTVTSRQSDDVVVSLDDVEVYFEGEGGGFFDVFSEPETVRAVDGVSLDIYEKEVVVLVGESGCGKTTLGKAAVGLQEPTGGTVAYRGQDIWQARNLVGDIDIPYEQIRQSLQIIHQDPGSALNSYKKVGKILEAPLRRWYPELDGNDRRQRILGMLEHVGMTPPKDYIRRYPFQLSGGEQQRVVLIRALLMNPDLILADEAVSALDVSLRVEMMDLMLDLQDEFDTSYLFISHNLSNARYIAKKTGGRIGVMYLGELVEIGTADQIIHEPRHPYTKALGWSTPELHPDAADAGDPPFRGIDVPDPTNPPSGCRYHTRCPEAREACRTEHPELVDVDSDRGYQEAACFMEYGKDHPYWDSDPLVDDEG